MHSQAFFDVDSLELSPNGRTYKHHPNFSSLSEEIFDMYNLISVLFAPLVFTVDVNGNTPDNSKSRNDFLAIPASKTEQAWKNLVDDRFKFYLQREASDDKKKNAVFINNQNAADCIKKIDAEEWYVFGSGINNVDHVIHSLSGLVSTVKFIPMLIVPGSDEKEEDLEKYFTVWEEMGAIPVDYKDVMMLAVVRKKKQRL